MALSPSLRILFIKEIANRLGTEEWPLIDLTLKQFKMPVSDEWGGNKPTYVLKMIENEPDKSLVELGNHLGFERIQPGMPKD
jgi:hypothetical protein